DVAREGEADQLPEAVLRSARVTGGALVLDPDLAEPDPAPEPAEKAPALRERHERARHPAVEEAEVAGVERDVDLGDRTQAPVEGRVGGALQEPVLAPAPDGVDDVVALAPLRDEARQHLGRILEIGVHGDDRITHRRVEARLQRRLMPEVAREVDHLAARVTGSE